jgi:ribosomal protein S3
MSKLLTLVRKLYNKDVEFNIVKLNKMHLNSDIYNQAVSLKLRNRENRLYRVLKRSLRKVKLPVISKIGEKISKPLNNDLLVNRVRNNNVSSMFADDNAKDPLNNLLLNHYPAADDLDINIKRRSSIKKEKVSLKGFVLRHYLKHLNVRGVRVEAKGRLTRRSTASRSVFKMK